MGLKYLEKNKDKIFAELRAKTNYFVRSGILLEYIKNNIGKHEKIIEIGCGDGKLAKLLRKNGYENLTLLDIDDYLLDDLKRFLLNIDVSREKIPFENENIDVILAMAVVEHLENPFFAAREIERVLKPGGILFMAVPNIFSMRSKFKFLFSGNLKGYESGNNHISIFTKSIRNKIFEGFDLVGEHYSRGYVRIGNFKLKLNGPFLNRHFGNKVMYIFKKKTIYE